MKKNQFGWKWAGLSELFSRQLPNESHDFIHIFSINYLDMKTFKPMPWHF